MADDDFKKTDLNLKVTLELTNQLTWGELYRFATIARNAGVPADAPVGIENDPMESEPSIVALSVYLEPDDLAHPSEGSPLT